METGFSLGRIPDKTVTKEEPVLSHVASVVLLAKVSSLDSKSFDSHTTHDLVTSGLQNCHKPHCQRSSQGCLVSLEEIQSGHIYMELVSQRHKNKRT